MTCPREHYHVGSFLGTLPNRTEAEELRSVMLEARSPETPTLEVRTCSCHEGQMALDRIRGRCHMGHKACKPSRDVDVGDLIYVLGTPRIITSLKPYDWYNEQFAPYTASTGTTSDGRGITIEHHMCEATEV